MDKLWIKECPGRKEETMEVASYRKNRRGAPPGHRGRRGDHDQLEAPNQTEVHVNLWISPLNPERGLLECDKSDPEPTALSVG